MSLGLESKVLTDNGFVFMKDLMDGFGYKMWNGDYFVSKNININFSDDIRLYKVMLNNGLELVCDEDYIKDICNIFNKIPAINPMRRYFDPFTRGLYATQLMDEDDNIIKTSNRELLTKLKYDYYVNDNNEYRIHVKYDSKYFVPMNYCMNDKVKWLDGFFSGGYELDDDNVIIKGNIKLLQDISLLLMTCGIVCRLHNYKLYIPQNKIAHIGDFNFLKLDKSLFDYEFGYNIEVESVVDTEYDYTYKIVN